MSELIDRNDNRATMHWKLLATASASALLAYLYSASAVRAEDTDRPTVWIELGGQLEALQGKDETYAPSFTIANLDHPLNAISPLSKTGDPNFAIGGEGKLTFQPENSGWVFSAGIRFGRSSSNKKLHQQTQTQYQAVYKTLKYNANTHCCLKTKSKYATHFNNVVAEHNENHAVIDFMAGHDVGLGMFGHGSSSVLSAGVRYAQFHSHAGFNFMSLPTNAGQPHKRDYPAGDYHHSYFATAEFSRDFNGIGPAASWEGNVPFAGNDENGKLTLDWGVNAALLFGNQKVRGHHHTYGTFLRSANAHYTRTSTNVPATRSRRVTVPNLGGFAGVSVRYTDVKFSIGYRADMFFNAIDGGIDTRKAEDRGFYGPYASISIGIGD